MDRVTAEWIVRQLDRLANSTQVVAQVSDEQDETTTNHAHTGADGTQQVSHQDLLQRYTSDQHQIANITGLEDEQAAQDQALADHTADEGDPHNTLKPWDVDAASGDLYPDPIVPGDAGIGTLEKAVAHIALGTQEDVGTSGIEGALLDNPDANGGGLMLIGIRDVDPQNPPDPPVENSQIWLLGSPVYVGSQIYLEVPRTLTADHEVLIGPSVEFSSGRHYAPLILGPEKIYSQTQDVTDATDYDVLDTGDVEIVSMTLTDPYVVGSSAAFSVYLENLGNKATLFDVILKVNGVEAGRYHRELVGNGSVVSDAFPTQNPLSAADVLSLDVEATSTHAQSQGWVRGTTQATTVRISQG